MIKTRFPCLLLAFALAISGCSIEIAQPSVETPTSQPAALHPTNSAVGDDTNPSLATTQIPITWSGLNLTGSLAYISAPVTGDVSYFISIQTLDLTTGEITPIFTTTGDDWVFYISVSPDAKQLVMSYIPPSQSGSSSNRVLYMMPLDATVPPQPLFLPPTPDDHYTQAEWSPDGKYIYYVHNNYQNQPLDQLYPIYEIFRMEYPNGQPEKVAERAFWPRVSPDSSRLVYISMDPSTGKNKIFLANADGSNPQEVELAGAWIPDIIDAPIFSPDGQSIIFSSLSPAQSYQPNWFEKLMGIQVAKAHSVPSDWWSVPVVGGVPTRLTQLQTINLFASISPDRQHIASLSGEGIFVMDLAGSNLTRLLFEPGVSGTVSWIP